MQIKSKIEMNKARKLAFAPHINIGVFSLEKNSPGWGPLGRKTLEQTLKKWKYFWFRGSCYQYVGIYRRVRN